MTPQLIVSFLIFPFSSTNSLDGSLIEEVFQGFLFTGIVVVQQQGVVWGKVIFRFSIRIPQ